MALTAAQQRCATTFDQSIAVIAGAGSGKTMTLRERVANAFFPNPQTGEPPVISSIDEVLAITFTEKAALELKGRVRQALRSRGLPEQAMLVDGAWIGTIHGMCSRILKENALALGHDPAFEIIGDEIRAQMLEAASEHILCNDDACRSDVAELFGEYRRDTIKQMIEELVECAVRSPQRFDSIRMPGIVAPVLPSFDPGACDADLFEQRLIAASHLLAPLMRVARTAYERFCAKKLELGYMDNNDLLLLAYDALQRDDIAALYRDRFKLVMVDEFQDTDSMQLAIIRTFTGENDERFCVVGDPQQSIYRFRGADLSVCEGHLAEVRASSGEAGVIKLADNFRSHADILDFVDIAFGPEGEEREDGLPNFYQRLVYRRNEDFVKPGKAWRPDEGPRVMVQEVQHAYRRVQMGRALSCELAARRLFEIHQASGRPWGDMAVLLGVMTHANDYAAALDRYNIPWIISGGSVFKDKGDALLMADLAAVLGNPRDSDALYAVLSSDIFGFAPEDFVTLSAYVGPRERVRDDGSVRLSETGFADAFAHLLAADESELAELAEQDTALGSHITAALGIIRRALARSGRDSTPDILESILSESGWLARMQASDSQVGEGEGGSVGGQARVANALKAIRIARELEVKGALGPRELSLNLLDAITGGKETPGILSAENSDFVRIMTVHASKGLQFPVVVAAELTAGGKGGGTPLKHASSGAVTCVLLDLQNSIEEGSDLDKCKKAFVDECKKLPMSADDARLDDLMRAAGETGYFCEIYDALRRYEDYQDAAELERKLYVAFTRAEEMLIVSMLDQVKSPDIEKALRAWQDDVYDVKGLKSTSKKLSDEERRANKEELDRLKEHVLLRGIKPNLKGLLARLAERREQIEGAGGEYRLIASPEVERWAVVGELPHVADPSSPEWQEGLEIPFERVDELPGEETELAPFLVAEEAQTAPGIRHSFGIAWSQGVLSASALHAAASADAFSDVRYTGSFSDEDIDELPASATEKGTAFHTVGEIAAGRWQPGEVLVLPEDRIEPVARIHGLNTVQTAELRVAAERWFASKTAAEMASHAQLVPEPPFFVKLAGKERELSLNGFIDLLAFDEMGAGTAWVVDYKTGTFLDTDEKRREAYEIQARTYAYALMLQGFEEVRLKFVFVEQPDKEGEPQVCEFPAAGEPAWTLEELAACLADEVERM